MIDSKTEKGQALLIQISNKFKDESDGEGLWKFLEERATNMSEAEIEVMRKKIKSIKLKEKRNT